MLTLESNTRLWAIDIDNDPEIFIEPDSKQIFKVRYGTGMHLLHALSTSEGYSIRLNILKSEIGLVGDIVEVISEKKGY